MNIDRVVVPVAIFALLTACATTPPPSSLTFTLSPSAGPDGLVAPGSVLTIRSVDVTDTNGRVSRITDRSSYRVEVVGGTYDQTDGSIRLAAEKSEVPISGYAIVVGLVGSPTVKATKQLHPDFALIHGPEPGDVTAFDAALVWNNEVTLDGSTALIPGAQYRLNVTVQDRRGRWFATDGSGLSIPPSRIDTRLRLMVGNPRDPTLLKAIESTIGVEENFTVVVRYGGDDRLVKTLTFPNDPAIRNGPDPHSVASVQILGGLAEKTKIGPGESHVLDVAVTDVRGRRWLLGQEGPGTHLSNVFPLPKSRLRVDTEFAEYDGETRVVEFQTDARTMPGKKFALNVMYDSNTDLADRREFEPDFLSIVPLMERDELVLMGLSGREGGEGRDGADGRTGRSSGQLLGRGGDGRPGGRGTAGQNGGRGGPGPELRVVARQVHTLDGIPLILMEIRAPGQEPAHYIRQYDARPVRITSQGGDGGNGGQGGDGGAGGDGGDGYFSGSGGDGGDAGDGGDGGDGGNGGAITLILDRDEVQGAFVLGVPGGKGGEGGRDGKPGPGGEPGSNGDFLETAKKETVRELPEAGEFGNEGNLGHVGRSGHDGLPGTYEIIIDARPAVRMERRAPEALRAVILAP